MKSKIMHWLAIILILEVGLVHYFNAQHEFEEAPLFGYLFLANFLGALLSSYGIFRRKLWGWGLGFAIAAGSIGGYIWSRTSGLPGLEAEPWLSAWGLLSLAVEGLFILFLFLRPWRTVAGQSRQALVRIPFLIPVTGLIALISVNSVTLRLEQLYPAEGHEHILTLREVLRQPVISQETLEQQYGMQVSLVAVSALDSIIDVRIKILDPEKAEPLLEEHTALLVDGTLILAPHQHRHLLKEGKPVLVFYPNLQNIVHSGTQVSLVFDSMRLEPLPAR